MSGGQTIATVGTTAQENLQISDILQSNFKDSTLVNTVVDTTSSTVTAPTQQLTVGTFDVVSVSNVTLSSAAPNSIVVADLSSAPTTTGAVTNLVVDSNAGSVVLQGTKAGTVTGLILPTGSGASLIVGDAGTQLIDGSRGTANQVFVTGAGNDTVVAGTGNDRVTLGDNGVANGGNGADTLIGGLGSATLGGGGGADSIVASSGGGMLIGESGNDTMVGGAGKDVFIYTSNGGNDVLSGFDPANDTLALANFSDIAAAGLSLTDIISRATVSGGNTILTMPDGSTITIAGVTGVNINWFTIK